MSSSFRWLVVTALGCCVNHASGFGGLGADSFHLMHDAVSNLAHHGVHHATATLATHQLHAASVAHHSHHMAPADLLGAYKNLLASHPLPTKMATGATLAVAGDAIAQSQDKDSPYDKRRASSFAVFDTAYRAVQHYSFPWIVQHCHGQFLAGILAFAQQHVHHDFHATPTTLLSSLMHHAQASPPPLVDPSYLAAMEQTLASQLGIVPAFYYPVFFALTAAVQGLDFDSGVLRAKTNFLPLMQRNLLFWIPVQFVQFAFVPQDIQIPFLSVCGLAWTCILSLSAGAAKDATGEQDMSDLVMDEMMMEGEEQDVTSSLKPTVVEEQLAAVTIR